MEGDLLIAPLLGLDEEATPKDCEVGVKLKPGGCMLSLDELGVRRGDLTVTCFAPDCPAVGVMGGLVLNGVPAAVGVTGGEMTDEVGVVGTLGGEVSTLRLGDFPICD